MSRALESLLVGRVLAGRYEVQEVVGRGGMSIVYRAFDRRLERQVALKVLSLPAGDAAARAELRERLRREAASAARIPPHPNVVQVYDHGTDAELGLDFITMELLRGHDLKAELAAGPLPPERALEILGGAAGGLAAGHRAGVVHRDVKPANIFLSDDGAVRLLDFGIAKALEPAPDDDLTRTGHMPLSPAYASPEQLRSETAPTPASDVYQLGLVAYEMLAGERPFPGGGVRAREAERLPERGRWPELSPAVQALLWKALRPAPADRFPDATAFAAAIPDVTLPFPTARPRAGPAARGGSRRASPALLRTAGAGALLLGALWLATRGPGAPADTGAGAGAETDAVVAPAEFAGLEGEFRELQREAVANLAEASSAEEGEAGAAAVRRVIADLNQSWVRGELDRHLSHYADRVDFYGVGGAPRSRIREERARDLEAYPEREITIERTAITFPEPGRARALVDKSWTFGGGESGERSGAGRQELLLERRSGSWKVVAERLLEQYR